MNHLVPCPNCDRHVRQSETACPFCSTELSLQHLSPPVLPRGRLGRAATFAFGASLVGATSLVACGGESETTKSGNGGTTSHGGSSTAGAGGSSAGTFNGIGGNIAQPYGVPPFGGSAQPTYGAPPFGGTDNVGGTSNGGTGGGGTSGAGEGGTGEGGDGGDSGATSAGTSGIGGQQTIYGGPP